MLDRIAASKIESVPHPRENRNRVTIHAVHSLTSGMDRRHEHPGSSSADEHRATGRNGLSNCVRHRRACFGDRIDQRVERTGADCSLDSTEAFVHAPNQPDQHIGEGVDLVGDVSQVPVDRLANRALHLPHTRFHTQGGIDIDHRQAIGPIEQEFALFARRAWRGHVDPGPLDLALATLDLRLLTASTFGVGLDLGPDSSDVGGSVLGRGGGLSHGTRRYQPPLGRPASVETPRRSQQGSKQVP